jgi:hypothetical protein
MRTLESLTIIIRSGTENITAAVPIESPAVKILAATSADAAPLYVEMAVTGETDKMVRMDKMDKMVAMVKMVVMGGMEGMDNLDHKVRRVLKVLLENRDHPGQRKDYQLYYPSITIQEETQLLSLMMIILREKPPHNQQILV